jgi:hypothetical protein
MKNILRRLLDIRVLLGFVSTILFADYLLTGPVVEGLWGYLWILILNPFFVVLRIGLNPYSRWELDLSPRKVRRTRYDKRQVPPGQYIYHVDEKGGKWVYYQTPKILPLEYSQEEVEPPSTKYRKKSTFFLHALTIIEVVILIRATSLYHTLIHCVCQYMPVVYSKRYENEAKEIDEIKKYGGWQLMYAYFPLLVEALFFTFL